MIRTLHGRMRRYIAKYTPTHLHGQLTSILYFFSKKKFHLSAGLDKFTGMWYHNVSLASLSGVPVRHRHSERIQYESKKNIRYFGRQAADL